MEEEVVVLENGRMRSASRWVEDQTAVLERDVAEFLGLGRGAIAADIDDFVYDPPAGLLVSDEPTIVGGE
jgi:hypothetical protein